MTVLHTFQGFTNPRDNGKYPVITIHAMLYETLHKKTLKFLGQNLEAVFNLLKPLGAVLKPDGVSVTDEGSSVNNIVKALLILKAKKIISPELLNQVCDGFPSYKGELIIDHRVREGVKNREVAEIRKTARWLALLKTDPNQPISQLPDELCTMIAALSGDQELLDEASSHRVARDFFKRPEAQDNSKLVGESPFQFAFSPLPMPTVTDLLADLQNEEEDLLAPWKRSFGQ